MTNSTKYPMFTLSKKFPDNVHSLVRSRVKSELKKPEPNILILEATPRSLGLQEFGTKFGFDVSELLAERK